MEISSTSARLKEIMNEKGLKQVDILIEQVSRSQSNAVVTLP